MCSYMAMFPPAMPHVFIEWLTEPGDVVYDPFSGRGTTILEACLSGRSGAGSDANPLAWLLGAAKSAPPRARSLSSRLDQLCHQSPARYPDQTEVPRHIRMLFAPSVLRQLLWIRTQLKRSSRVDRYLLAVLAGMLHGNANRDGRPRGLTVAMPNTFAMAPGYVERYIRHHKLKPPVLDVLRVLRTRVDSFPLPEDGFSKGVVWKQDAARSIRYPKHLAPAKLIFTSPPYLGVIKYGKFNWIRHWLLGTEPREVDSCLFASGSLTKYLAFMSVVLRNLSEVTADDGFVCIVVGDVRRGSEELRLADEISQNCIDGTGLRVIGILRDSIPTKHKVSRIWGKQKGRATRTDRILILGKRGAKLPRLPRAFRWR